MIHQGDHVVDLVDDYLHGLLSGADAHYVRMHVEECITCKLALHQARGRMSLFRNLPAIEPSEELIQRTVEQIKQSQPRSGPRHVAWRKFLTAMAAAIVIVGALHLYFALAKPSPYDLRVVVQAEMMSDTPASMRAVVMRGDTGAPVSGAKVSIDLVDRKKSARVKLASFTTDVQGSGAPQFQLPNWTDGDYELEVIADPGFRGDELITRPLKLRRSWKLMLSCDKPVYQPGQTIHFRALALRQPDLKPVAGQEAVFTVTDPKGNVIFKTTGVTSRFGITSADCALADEIIEGAYVVQCTLGPTESKQSVQVQKYVLPKFRIELGADKAYYQPGQRMKLSIRANYFFGKPVSDAPVEVQIEDGSGNTRSTLKMDADGAASLEIPIPDRLIGRPQDGGDARVTVNVLVRDSAGQEQRRSISRVVTANPLRLELIPESGQIVSGISNTFYVLTTYADGTPAQARVSVSGLNRELRTSSVGVASFEMKPASPLTLTISATDDDGLRTTRQVPLNFSTGANDFVIRTNKAVYRGGESMKIVVLGGGNEPVFIDLIKDGQTLLTQTVPVTNGRGEYQIDLPPEIFGTLQLSAYRMGSQGLAERKSRLLYISQPQDLKLRVVQDKPEYRPGDEAKLDFTLTDSSGKPTPGAISLAAVDEAVFSVLDAAPGMEKTFFTLEQELLKPVYEIYGWSPDQNADTPSAAQAEFERALFSRGTGEPTEKRAKAREILEKAVREGDLDRYTLDVLDDPDSTSVLEDGSIEEPFLSMLKEARGQSPSLVSSYPQKAAAFEVSRRMWLSALAAGWGALIVVAIIAGLIWLAQAGGWPRVFFWLSFLAFCLLLVSILMPSLNRARETADRVRVGGRLRALSNVLVLDSPLPGPQKGAEAAAGPRLRQFFPETLLWRPELITDEQGRASLNLSLADSITTWRLSGSAVSASGKLGALNSGIRVFQPFFVDLNLPVALTRNDEITLPVAVYSYLDRDQTVELTLQRQSDWYELLDEPVKRVQLKAGEVRGVSYRLRARRVGMHELQISARGEGVGDAVKRMIEIIPDGRRVEQIANGVLQPAVSMNLNLPADAIEGSGRLTVKIYPSSFSQLVEGLDGIFQRPSGCFEQTSSTTYPNILALDYLRKTGKSAPEVEARAREYIHLGYQRLVGFEVPGGGFDWFGHPPANLVLTAYGLMEFEDMSKVYNVDPKLIERTRNWLLAQRNSQGMWSSGPMLHDGLADSVVRGADATLASTAYVAWAVFGSGQKGSDATITRDYLRTVNVNTITDPYLVAILANAGVAIERDARHTADVLDRLVRLARTSADGKQTWWEQPTDSRTAFYGSGQGGTVETTALATVALIHAGRDPQLVRGALAWLIAQKDARGTLPSTQATVLALKALIEGTGKPLGAEVTRSIRLTMNDDVERQISIPVAQAEVMQQIDLTDRLRPGDNRINLEESTGSASGYQIAYHYNVPAPQPQDDQPLAIILDYDRSDLKVGQTMTATARVTNRMGETAPMVILDLPIPAGFAPDPADFAKLIGAGGVAKYQITPRSIIVYLRSLAPNQPMTLSYRLNATMPVKITAPPARVYEYYNPARQAESAPRPISVSPAA